MQNLKGVFYVKFRKSILLKRKFIKIIELISI